MSENKKPCPQFPYWGASYPDACCVDLDYCDENVIFMIRERMFPAHFAGQKNL